MLFYLLATLLCINAILRTVSHYFHNYPERARYEADWWKMALGMTAVVPARREQ